MSSSRFPTIQRAIPAARYHYGEYQVTVLEEIESLDPVSYRYLMAFVREGESRPVAFISCEPANSELSAQGRYQLRVINSSLDEAVAADDRYGALDTFCEQGLALGGQLLSLEDELPFKLM